MLKTRLIPILLIQNGNLVRSEKFSFHRVIGDPLHSTTWFSGWEVDELIYLDISRTDEIALRRDVKHAVATDSLGILDQVSRHCRVPLTFGGGIRTLRDIDERLDRGADKVSINGAAFERPEFITEAAKEFGSQCLVVSIDAKKESNGSYQVYSHHGKEPTGYTPSDWAARVKDLGAGEILLNSIDRDGSGEGYDTELIRSVTTTVRIPTIACGGVGTNGHFVEGVRAGAAAVSAANFFHFTELSDKAAKRALQKSGVEVRI